MKKVLAVCAMKLCVLISGDCLRAGEWEVLQAVDYFVPENALWDEVFGGEMKVVYWQNPGLGLALAGGLSQWESAGDRSAVILTSNRELFQAWEGDMQFVPLGASLLLREHYTSRDLGECQLTVEAGCRYLRCNSGLELVETDRVRNNLVFQETVTKYAVDCDDAIVGRLAGTLAISVGDQATLFVGGGYQFNIDRGSISVDSRGQSLPMDLSALFAQVGLAFFLK